MKKFSFSLEPVLNFRAEKEEKAVLEQSLAQGEHQRRLEALEGTLRRLAGAGEEGKEKITAEDLLARTLYIDYLTECRDKQQSAVEKALRGLEIKRRLLTEARQDRMILEKLKSRLRQKYLEDLNKWESRINDDQCTALTYRKKGLGVRD